MYGANILNKRSRTADKGCVVHLVVGRGPNIDSTEKEVSCSRVRTETNTCRMCSRFNNMP
jgi:hypothetical protein